MWIRIVCAAFGFFFGSIPSGYLVGKYKGVDLKQVGSGNVGSTNVLRTMGRKYALLTLILDMMKCIVPVILTSIMFYEYSEMHYLITLYTGSGAVFGHIFSPFLKFKGGKGIATSGGMLICLDPILAFCTIAMVFVVTAVTGYVSLGSIIAALVVIIFHIIMILTAYTPGWWFYKQNHTLRQGPEIMCVILILAAVVLFRHRENIKRLFNGTENKVSLKGRK